jgi:hypothetical protein
MYSYGVIFTQGFGSSTDAQVMSNTMLKKHFSTLPRSVLVLFLSISGGMNWEDVVQPLGILHPAYIVLFLTYVAFVVFAVLNVVTGVFCQNAIESAARDEEEVVEEIIKQKELYVKRLQAIFNNLESAGDGYITIHQFEEHLRDEKSVAWFRMLDLEIDDAWTLFKLMDVTGTGLVDADEFVAGCLQLRGHAKSIDLAKLGREINLTLHAVHGNDSSMADIFGKLQEMDRKLSRMTKKTTRMQLPELPLAEETNARQVSPLHVEVKSNDMPIDNESNLSPIASVDVEHNVAPILLNL